jgi:hypothetical protein
MNAEIRRTKARLLEEIPKLQRLAFKQVVFVNLLYLISYLKNVFLLLETMEINGMIIILGVGERAIERRARGEK